MKHETSIILYASLYFNSITFPETIITLLPLLHPLHFLSTLKSPHLPLCTPLWLPCLMLPPVPQTAPITGVHPRGAGHNRAANAVKKQNYISLWLYHYTRRYEAERLWHISGTPRELICASPVPWHRLNPISHFTQSMSCVLGRTHTHLQIFIQAHTGLKAQILHESRLKTDNH